MPHKILFLLPIIGLFFFACTYKKSPAVQWTPEELVKQFVTLSASCQKPEDRKKLQSMTSNELWRTFERMGDEAFRMIYMDSKLTVKNFEILSSTSTGDLATVNYRVTVDNQQGTDPTTEINEREVRLKRENGSWLIEAIRLKGSDHIAFTRGMLF